MHITFWTTNDCNLNCSYCYNRIGNNIKKEYMSDDVADKAIELLQGLECWNDDDISIQFHGGEPLLNVGVIEHIMERFESFFPREKISYALTTNGTLFDERRKKIIDKIDELSVSIDGKAENHDLNRKYLNGKGSYDRVMRIISEITKTNEPRLRMTVTHDTVSSLADTVCYFLDEGFRRIVPVMDMYDGHWNDGDDEIILGQFAMIREHIDSCGYDDAVVSYVSNTLFTRKAKCSGGVDSFHFMPDGKIYPCSLAVGDSEWLIGNTDTGLDQEVIDRLQQINDVEVSGCSGCEMYEYCSGPRCKLVNRKVTGDFYTASSVECLSTRLQLEFV